MDKKAQTSKIFVIKTDKIIKQFTSTDIVYIECDTSVCDVYFADGDKFACVRPLKYFEENLADLNFVRINHNALVNIYYIKEIKCIAPKKKKIVLKDNKELDISYRKWSIIKAKINEHCSIASWRTYK